MPYNWNVTFEIQIDFQQQFWKIPGNEIHYFLNTKGNMRNRDTGQ